MTTSRGSYADRTLPALSALSVTRRSEAVLTSAARALKLAVADALYACALVRSTFATRLVPAAPHLELFIRCFLDGNG